MIQSPRLATSLGDAEHLKTASPWAFSTERLSLRRASHTTLTPLSLRLRAGAWPWEP